MHGLGWNSREKEHERSFKTKYILRLLYTSFPSGFLITTPSTTGDFLASACAYSGPTVYTYVH